jgi:hypothetical protein
MDIDLNEFLRKKTRLWFSSINTATRQIREPDRQKGRTKRSRQQQVFLFGNFLFVAKSGYQPLEDVCRKSG